MTIENGGYSDIIINASSFPLVTNTLLGNPITDIYLNMTDVGRVYQVGCFNNTTLKCVYFMCPTVLSAFYQPGSNITALFTAT